MTLSHNWYSGFMGFKPSLWLCIFGILLSMMFFIIIFSKMASYLMKIKHNLTNSKVIVELMSIMLTATSINDYSIPGTGSLFIGWAVFCLVISQLYSTDLILFLTIPRFEKRIDSTTDFVKANISWGLFRLSNFEYLNMELEADREIRSKFQIEQTHKRRLQGIQKNNYGVLVYSFDRSAVVLEGFDDIPVGNLRLMKNCLTRPYFAYGFPQNSPFKKAIDEHIVRLFETGIAKHIKLQEIRQHQKIIWQSVSHEKDHLNNEPQVLTLPQLHGAFLVLLIGCFLASIVFAIETFWWKKIKWFSKANKNCVNFK